MTERSYFPRPGIPVARPEPIGFDLTPKYTRSTYMDRRADVALQREVEKTIESYDTHKTNTSYSRGHYANDDYTDIKYISQISSYKYPHWRRIEDTRKVYSVSGILLLEGTKYTMELTQPLLTTKEQTEAIDQLIKATVEYGYVAPEPCTERWIYTNDEYLTELQNIRVELFNLYNENHLLEYKNKKEREDIWKFIITTDNYRDTIEELMESYKPNMFDPDKPNYKQTNYVNKRLKKKAKQ